MEPAIGQPGSQLNHHTLAQQAATHDCSCNLFYLIVLEYLTHGRGKIQDGGGGLQKS